MQNYTIASNNNYCGYEKSKGQDVPVVDNPESIYGSPIRRTTRRFNEHFRNKYCDALYIIGYNYKNVASKNLIAPISSEYCPNPIVGGIAIIRDIPQIAHTYKLVSMVS